MKKAKSTTTRKFAKAPVSGKTIQPWSHKNTQQNEIANVKYFFDLLNQVSKALNALGYVDEGAALDDVRVDLDSKLFHCSAQITEIAQRLH